MTYNIDPELTKIAKQKIPANMRILPILNRVMKVFKCESDEEVTVEKQETPGFEGAVLSTFVIEPKECKEVLPAIVFFHGGGFMLKASSAHYQIAKWYAKQLSCKVIYTDYRLAPKYQFPIPVEDCYCTYKWVLDKAEQLGIDSKRILIAGDSAGGNLAAAVTLMLRDRDQISPLGAMLIYPVTDRRMVTESMKNYVDTPVWDANLSKMMWEAYLGEDMPSPLAYASPMEAESLKEFPQTYMEVSEFDSLRDEGLAFAKRLMDEGVSVELHEVKGACHGFETALDSKMVQDAMERRVEWLAAVLILSRRVRSLN